MSKIVFRLILICVLVLLAGLLVLAWWSVRSSETVTESNDSITSSEQEQTSDESTNLFEVDPGVRVTFASNPIVLAQTDKTLTLAYEYRSEELKNAPEDRVRVMTTQDGLTFEQEDPDEWMHVPEPIQLPDGTYRRYFYNAQAGGLQSESSSDGGTFTLDDGLRYQVSGAKTNDPNIYGVSTYFVDSQGGVILLYNSTIDNEIVVNRAYASPETSGLTFVFDRADILGGALEDPHYAVPHTLVLDNGDIWLVIMNQSRTNHPPQSREGVIYAYVSRDDGETFDLAGRLVDWEDFVEFDVYSLNDPKLVEFSDGTLRVYVAAMVQDEEVEGGYRWDLVSAHD